MQNSSNVYSITVQHFSNNNISVSQPKSISNFYNRFVTIISPAHSHIRCTPNFHFSTTRARCIICSQLGNNNISRQHVYTLVDRTIPYVHCTYNVRVDYTIRSFFLLLSRSRTFYDTATFSWISSLLTNR